jgi:cytochrome oxidase assembly protein ShyY1
VAVYRFLLSARWLGYAALAVAMAVGMVLLGNWQFSRYQQRVAANERIEAGARATPVPIGDVLSRPGSPGTAGPGPSAQERYVPVTVTGRYDTGNEILVRGRSQQRQLGFEVVTPLVLDDGTAVLVDRGWVPAPPNDARAVPVVPAAPAGTVTATGRVHPSESRPRSIERREGRIEVRRIAVPQLAAELRYPLYGAYLLLTAQSPPADPELLAIEIDRQNSMLNAGYSVQWWVFAAMVLVGYGWLARREARGPRPQGNTRPEPALTTERPTS